MEVIVTGQTINELVRRSGYTNRTAAEVRRLGEHLQHKQSRFLVTQVAEEIEPMCRGLGPLRRANGPEICDQATASHTMPPAHAQGDEYRGIREMRGIGLHPRRVRDRAISQTVGPLARRADKYFNSPCSA
ncbi:MAG: hypothetical protein EA381_00365 [Planctomycetaceae bacterium]|nr:MAG: hypothetical protein EA381_00365 [Planctomycetaceae bacterium]